MRQPSIGRPASAKARCQAKTCAYTVSTSVPSRSKISAGTARSYETSARAKPSQPFVPTVWIAVASRRGSAATSSKKRRIPRTRGSPASVAAERAELEDPAGAGEPRQQLQQLALGGRHLGRRHASLGARPERVVEHRIRRDEEAGQVAVDRRPPLVRQGQAPRAAYTSS